MRFIKVVGILVLIAVVCRTALILLLGRPPSASLGLGVTDAAGGGLMIFGLSTIAAGIAAFVTRDRGDTYPGLTTGVIVALVVTALMFLNGG